MVILQFNKLIRNKWVWGVFAIIVSLAFVAPEEWFRGASDERPGADVRNKLGGVEFDAKLFDMCEKLVRDFLPNFQRSPVARCFDRNSQKDVWKAYAAAIAAKEAGFAIPDEVLADRVKALFSSGEGGFSEAAYAEQVRAAFGIEPVAFEEMLRLWLSVETALENFAASTAWAAPSELDQNLRDYTDRFTVRVARFDEDKKKAEAVKLDDAALEKWYKDNISSFALPERCKLRFVMFDPSSSNALAKAVVKEEDVKARYDENAEKGMYDIPPATTNDVKKVKPFEEVKAGIEIALKREASLQLLKDEVRAMIPVEEDDEEAAAGLLAKVAKSAGLSVSESDWFSLSGRLPAGFGKSPESIFPGVPRREFDRAVKSLYDYRFATFASKRGVWLAELAARSEAHTPSFADAKAHIGERALGDARQDAFKASVEEIAAKGADAVLATANVSTNIVFSPCEFGRDRAFGWENFYGEWNFREAPFQDAEKIVFAARSLQEGGVSGFVPLSAGKGALVVCTSRKAGDLADYPGGERFARMVAMRMQSLSLYSDWLEWNLKRMGYAETPSQADGEAADAGAEE